MRSSDLARIIPPMGGQPELGMRAGILLSYDISTGSNSVLVAGQTFLDLPFLAAGTVAMAPGDQVALLRYENTYFILGAMRAAGSGTLTTRSARVTARESTTLTNTYGDLSTVGPRLTDVYIGPSQQCLVFVRAAAYITNGMAAMDFEVTGASSISATGTGSDPASIGAPSDGQIIGSICSVTLLTAASGLNAGLNTFTAKYGRFNAGEGTSAAEFEDRTLTVIPF